VKQKTKRKKDRGSRKRREGTEGQWTEGEGRGWEERIKLDKITWGKIYNVIEMKYNRFV